VTAPPTVRPTGVRPVSRPAWESAYSLSLVVLDAVAVTLAGVAALLLEVGSPDTQIRLGGAGLGYTAVAAVFAPVWVVVLAASRSYEGRFIGTGSEEFKRVVNGTVRFTALVSTTAFIFQADLSRGFVAVALPSGLVLLLIGRYAARKVVVSLRFKGKAQHRAVVVGSFDEVCALAERMAREPYAGMRVVAVCLPDDEARPVVVAGRALPLISPARDIAHKLASVGADTVAVAGTSALSARELRELAWQLEGTGVDLALSPALTDVAGPRIHVRPVAGLPLLHVEEPTFGGSRKLVKDCLDLAASGLLLVLLMPLLLAIALLIKREDSGPVFYRQERVGRDGRAFRIWKFRSMRVDADQMLAELADRNEQSGPLFKMRADPRLTRIGSVIRKYSLDELPQLFNVLLGSMSLVGPRPPLQSEVSQYADHVHRRLLVKPGMTGLWQVSGRADLEWEEAVRLDLYYVENWSVALDFMILWKTLFAVIRGEGAY
jgi:exopolysaccharide biosynthesis polyprenyl glycosylphosphotransferase